MAIFVFQTFFLYKENISGQTIHIFCKATILIDIKEGYLVLWVRPHVHELFPLHVSHSGQRWSCSHYICWYAIEVLLLQLVSHLPLSFFEQIRKCIFHRHSIFVNGELTLNKSMHILLNIIQMMFWECAAAVAAAVAITSSINKCQL